MTIDIANASDLNALIKFYQDNAHDYVAFRSDMTTSLLEHGQFLVAKIGSEIVGAGAIDLHRATGAAPFAELIQGRVTTNGKGIYRILIACRVALTRVKLAPSRLIVCEVDEINVRTRYILEQMGFTQFGPPPELYQAAIDALPLAKRPEALGYGFVWYSLASSVADHMVSELSDSLLDGGPDSGRALTVTVHPLLASLLQIGQ